MQTYFASEGMRVKYVKMRLSLTKSREETESAGGRVKRKRGSERRREERGRDEEREREQRQSEK